jgi:hypothetical protein
LEGLGMAGRAACEAARGSNLSTAVGPKKLLSRMRNFGFFEVTGPVGAPTRG